MHQAPQCVLLGAGIADAYGMLSHAVELFAMPCESAQEGQRVCDVLYADRGCLGLLEVEEDARVRTDGAFGWLNSHTFTALSSPLRASIFLRRMSSTLVFCRRADFRLARPLAILSPSKEY